MIIGDPSNFAIESEITLAYDEPGQMALGFFVLHIVGRCYGVRKSDATMLANAFDEVGTRIAQRGKHNPSFAKDSTAEDIAYSLRRAIYDESEKGELFFGMSVRSIYKRSCFESSRMERILR
jgi:hypothetical protein